MMSGKFTKYAIRDALLTCLVYQYGHQDPARRRRNPMAWQLLGLGCKIGVCRNRRPCPGCGELSAFLPYIVTSKTDYELLFGFFGKHRETGGLFVYLCCGWTGWISQNGKRTVEARED